MKVTVTTSSDVTFTVDVSEDLTLENLKAICEAESGTPASQILVVSNGRLLTGDTKSLNELDITDGAHVILQDRAHSTTLSQLDFGGIEVPNGSDSSPECSDGETEEEEPFFEETLKKMREDLLNNPDELASMRETDPELAEAILKVNSVEFFRLTQEILRIANEEEELEERLIDSDEEDVDLAKAIEESISGRPNNKREASSTDSDNNKKVKKE